MSDKQKSLYVPTAELPRERVWHFADHEILLAFLNDSDAEYFEGWWRDVGNESYAQWIQKVKEEATTFDD